MSGLLWDLAALFGIACAIAFGLHLAAAIHRCRANLAPRWMQRDDMRQPGDK